MVDDFVHAASCPITLSPVFLFLVALQAFEHDWSNLDASKSSGRPCHLRRRFVKLVRNTKSPIADAAVRQIATLYAVEATVRGASPQVRLAARQEHSAPIIGSITSWKARP